MTASGTTPAGVDDSEDEDTAPFVGVAMHADEYDFIEEADGTVALYVWTTSFDGAPTRVYTASIPIASLIKFADLLRLSDTPAITLKTGSASAAELAAMTQALKTTRS